MIGGRVLALRALGGPRWLCAALEPLCWGLPRWPCRGLAVRPSALLAAARHDTQRESGVAYTSIPRNATHPSGSAAPSPTPDPKQPPPGLGSTMYPSPAPPDPAFPT